MLAVCLFGIGVVPAFGREGKTPRIYPARAADAYVLSRTGGNSTMNVSIEDLMALRSRFSDDFLWFRRRGKEYMVSDRAVIEEAARCFDPLQPLRPEQEALAQRDRALDREEEALDRELDAWDDADDAESRNEVRLDDEHRRDVETRLRAVRDQQRDLEREERILDERQEVLEKAAEAKLDLVIDDALRRGLARPFTTP